MATQYHPEKKRCSKPRANQQKLKTVMTIRPVFFLPLADRRSGTLPGGTKRKESEACIGDDDERSRRRIVVVDKIRHSRNTHKKKENKRLMEG